MDRTAWIVISLCVIGLVAWEWWAARQAPPRASTIAASPTATPLIAGASPSPAPLVSPLPSATPAVAESVPSFPEKIETLRNADVELRLTNRGGGINEAVLLRQIAEKGQRVVLNSAQNAPIGAIIEQPSTSTLPEFTASTESNSVVQFEGTTAEQVAIRKKFFFEKSSEN